MIKKIGLPLIALAAVLAFATPKQADARVRFGVAIGGPVYTAPVPYAYPNYGYPYYSPYAAPVAPYTLRQRPIMGLPWEWESESVVDTVAIMAGRQLLTAVTLAATMAARASGAAVK
jgi:hypothetical protein